MTVLEYAQICRSVTEACRDFEVSRSSFYEWKNAFDKEGKAELMREEIEYRLESVLGSIEFWCLNSVHNTPKKTKQKQTQKQCKFLINNIFTAFSAS
ncbi:helix-turn-helix domain-containing protein [Acidobacteriota bacterium]